MKSLSKYKIPADYGIILFICVSMVIAAFCLDTPHEIADGFYKINASRSVLISDYVAMGGIGAAFVNAAISGFFYLTILIGKKIKPTGKIIMALFLTIGFSLFGKNLINMLPIFLGVWIYAKIRKERLHNYILPAMLSGTVAPIVSEIAFMNGSTSLSKIIAAIVVGLFIGTIFPIVVEAAKRMHHGYCLYNGGVAGGFIATFFVGVLASLGMDVLPLNYWSTEYTVFLASFAFFIAVVLILYGLFSDKPAQAFRKYRQLLKESDKDHDDYLTKYGKTCYINIGILCIVSTSLMLFLKIPINGPVLGGIFAVTGFAAAGKHLRNTVPVLLGSTIGAFFNFLDVNDSMNSLAILFSTGMAPISGKYGWYWGVVAGFIHVSVAIIIGDLNGGMNLYNNGFAGGFLAITLVPIIIFLREFIHNKKAGL